MHIYLSPHLDDAIFSCGGLIAQQAIRGEEVLLVTICAGDPPPGPLSPFAEELHRRWGGGEGVVARRRAEDRSAARLLEQAAAGGAVAVRHLGYADAIYRRDPAGSHLYTSEAAIFGPPHPAEADLVRQLAQELEALVPPGADLLTPSAVGGHVDHRWVRAAAERVAVGRAYYFDLPYAARGGEMPPDMVRAGRIGRRIALSAGEIDTWEASAAAYASQFPTFWAGRAAWRAEMEAFLAAWGGFPLLLAPRAARGADAARRAARKNRAANS
jgi:LmbE family N-acetylglucosaminyl deacetylase